MNGKTILITGSTDGVGRAVAERLAADGAHVLVHGRDRKRGESLVAAIAASGKGKATLYLADLTSLDAADRLNADLIDAALNGEDLFFIGQKLRTFAGEI